MTVDLISAEISAEGKTMTPLGPTERVAIQKYCTAVIPLPSIPNAGYPVVVHRASKRDLREVVRPSASKTKLRPPIYSRAGRHRTVPIPVVGGVKHVQKVGLYYMGLASSIFVCTYHLYSGARQGPAIRAPVFPNTSAINQRARAVVIDPRA